jgi:hypothetical protein
MQAIAKVTRGAIDVRQVLALLGLTPEVLSDAILFGEKYRALCTPNDPRIFQGTTAWARTHRGLRESLIPLDWKKDDTGGFDTVVNPDGSLAVSVTTGGKGTGRYTPGANPKLKHPHGVLYKDVVDQNRSAQFLFPDMAADAKARADKIVAAATRSTWILLIRREGDVVFSELSLPLQFSGGGQVEDWKYRIVLEPLDADPIADIGDDAGEDGGEEIDIPVSLR